MKSWSELISALWQCKLLISHGFTALSLNKPVIHLGAFKLSFMENRQIVIWFENLEVSFYGFENGFLNTSPKPLRQAEMPAKGDSGRDKQVWALWKLILMIVEMD